ncbi:hypothetical protein [Sphingomonas zeae]|jgi:hypothetical protein
MSYRIAHVRFTKYGRTYPVNCYRRDLKTGDVVVVGMAQEGIIKVAELDSVEFLNWNCANSILGKRSEFQRGADGCQEIVRGVPKGDTLETFVDLFDKLKGMGWLPFKPTSKVWKVVFSKSLPSISGIIAFRKNGIDFQSFDGPVIPGISGRHITISIVGGVLFSRNWYYKSGIDLFDFTVSFANALERREPNLVPYYKGIGQKPPKPFNFEVERDELADLRNALNGGTGEPVYLCDDVWI